MNATELPSKKRSFTPPWLIGRWRPSPT